jgi:hypothetical protein
VLDVLMWINNTRMEVHHITKSSWYMLWIHESELNTTLNKENAKHLSSFLQLKFKTVPKFRCQRKSISQ